MALTPNSAFSGLWPDRAIATVTRWAQGLFHHTDFSPEETLAEAKNIDPRLLPRVPMSAQDIDVSLLGELGKMGMKRGKRITEQSHPELMHAWQTMSMRAGLKKTPQLILVESDTANAFTLSSGEEVVVTTGLFKLLDAREVTAVLGHEFAHEQSDHQRPRIAATVLLGGGGILLGDRFAKRGGIGPVLQKWVKGEGKFKQFLNWKFGAEAKPTSVLGALVYMAIGGWLGNIVANQLTVRPTELDADAKSIAISGDPQALISALTKLEQSRPAGGLKKFFAYLQSGYPSTGQRIDQLRTMVGKTPVEPLLASAAPVPVLPPIDLPGHTISHVAADTRVQEPAQQIAAASTISL